MEKILISHRGNIDGKQPTSENSPNYILNAIHLGYDVEIDVWYSNGFWLGHDHPEYLIELVFLKTNAGRLWCHAKNLEAMVEMKKYPELNYFWHQNDDVTLTSKGDLWAYPGKQPIKNSIAVLPEIHNDNLDMCKGICSDNIKQYKNIIK
jgi:hypothetical protein